MSDPEAELFAPLVREDDGVYARRDRDRAGA